MKRVSVFDPLKAWIRRTVRKHTRPMSVDEAAEKKEFFSVLYVISTFALFCQQKLIFVQKFVGHVLSLLCISGYISAVGFAHAPSMIDMSEKDRMKEYVKYRTDDEPIRIITFKNFTKVSDKKLSTEEIRSIRQEISDQFFFVTIKEIILYFFEYLKKKNFKY